MSEAYPSPAALLEKALSLASADHTEVSFFQEDEASTRFANNVITQNIARRVTTLNVRSAFRQQVGQASGTDLSEEGIRECVARAEAIARASEPDTEFLPLPGPQQYPTVDGYDAHVADATPEERAEAVRRATEIARDAKLKSAGSFATDAYLSARANSAGLYHEQRLTSAHFVCTCMTDDSSGWAQSAGSRWGEMDPAEDASIAARKALAAVDPEDLPPGEYTVVLEPAAVADFFGFLSWTMDAKAAHEGRSAFTGKEGERVGAPVITLSSQIDHPDVPGFAAGEDGLRIPTTTWIEDGVLKTLSYSRYWAAQSGRPFTDRPANLIMAGGEHSLDELIASVDRGVLVTRFWYIRFVDPMKLLLTGMTRDGLYLIEGGKVTRGLKNLRFNESPLECLERVSALGRPTRAGRGGWAYVPAMRLEGFRFTSGTAF